MERVPHRLETVARPKQSRSERTLYRILDAAEALIAEKGLADASVPEIVRRAGSSVGGFYARFRDKNELLRALEERFFDDVSDRLDALSDAERWAGTPTPVIVRACVAELVAVVGERQNLIAAFVARGAQDVEFRLEALRFRRRVSERIARLLLGRRDELAHPEPELAIDLGVQLAFGLMLQRVIFGEIRAGGRTLDDAALRREIERTFTRYVGLRPEEPPRADASGAPDTRRGS